MVIVGTALVINWKYETAKSRIDRFEKNYPRIDSLEKLNKAIDKTPANVFIKDYLNINPNPVHPELNPKYVMLVNLCKSFLEYKKMKMIKDDKEAMKDWADNVDVFNIKDDFIGRIKGVGPGVVLNILLSLGYDVVKPDRHVIATSKNQFNLKIAPYEFANLSNAVGESQLYLDKVLFEFGRNKLDSLVLK